MGVNLSLSADFIKGDVYQNNIENVFGTKVTISFPPGKWKVVKTSNFSQIYTNSEFRNTKDGAVLNIGLPNQTISGKFTSRLKKCKYDNKNTLHATGIIRSGLHTRYCIKSDKNWLMIELNGMTLRGTGIFSGYYNLLYPVKKSIVASLTNDKLESIGISLMQAFRKNTKGQPGDYSAVKELLSFNDNLDNSTSSSNSKYVPPSKSMSSLSDKEVCSRATVSNGLGWENVSSNFGDYVKEAFKRKLSLYECRKLTDRFPKTETIAKIDSVESSLKDKLKELKSMLDEGLISQELYDTKSAKLLEDF